jgi:putative ABC transport system permease protein
VVIDQLLARKRFPQQNPVGRYITMGGKLKFRIVGVVPSVKTGSLAESVDRETLYFPFAQFVAQFSAMLPPQMYQYMNPVIKTAVPPYTLTKPLKKLVARVAPTVSISGFKSMRDIMADSIQNRQATMTLVLVFGAIALLLAVIGIYSVIAYSVRQRRQECGVRLALGATPRDLLWLIIGDGLRLLAVGLVFGLIAAVALGYAFSSQLFGVAPYDPATLAGVVVVLAAVTMLACYLPARTAARLDPATALE